MESINVTPLNVPDTASGLPAWGGEWANGTKVYFQNQCEAVTWNFQAYLESALIMHSRMLTLMAWFGLLLLIIGLYWLTIRKIEYPQTTPLQAFIQVLYPQLIVVFTGIFTIVMFVLINWHRFATT